MRLLLQRVKSGSVLVAGHAIADIGKGLVILLGIGPGDGESQVRTLTEKVANLRIFEDEQGKMNRSVLEIGGSALGFGEQARTFARAETIVAVAGAGLANMVFAPREATVLELHNVRKGADFFALLAQQLGMRYGRVTGELLLQPAVIANNRDFRIDPAVFRQVMGEVHPGA